MSAKQQAAGGGRQAAISWGDLESRPTQEAAVSLSPRLLVSPSPPLPLPSGRRGVTLVELLVVISILMMLAVIAVPSMRPAMEGRRVRETARSIGMYLARARIRAMETGVSCGVELTRWSQQPEAAILLRQIQVPPPFTGLSADAVVRVQQWDTGSPTGVQVYRVLVRDGDFDNFIRDGDLIQFGVSGWRPGTLTYMILDVSGFVSFAGAGAAEFPPTPRNGELINFNPSGKTTVQDPSQPSSLPWINSHVLTCVLIDRAVSTPWPKKTSSLYDPVNNPASKDNWSGPEPFCILRQPVPSEVQPVQLPEQMCIDLCESGTDGATFEPVNAYTPVRILFSPSGSLEAVRGVYHAATGVSLINAPERIYLMVGRQDRLPLSAVYPSVSGGVATTPPRGSPQNEDTLRNWQDTKNLWVTINPLTGLSGTVEDASWSPPVNFDYNARDAQNNPTDRLTALGQARKLARQAESMGGR